MKAPRALTPTLKVLVTALLLFLVFRSVDISKIRHDLGALNGGLLAFLVVVCWVGQLACAQRWRLFAAGLDLRGGYLTFVQLYFVGMLFNIGLPSLIGGDVVKSYVLSRKMRKPLHLALASVLQDRAAGMISLFIYGTAAILIHPVVWRGVPLWLAYAAIWAGILTALLLAWKGDRIYERLQTQNTGALLRKALSLIADFHRALITIRLSPGAIAQVSAYSFFNSALVYWMFQKVSVATGHPVDFVGFSALFPLMTLVTMFPISLGGLGIREWAYVEGLALLAVPGSNALLIALTTSALLIVCDLIGLLFLPAIPAELRRPPEQSPGVKP
ncbi:MAG TPA: lysylphosphatidylglycerol synthase transmembrane domain-containing protein [Acidobacteriota bacterium]|nr:lysylphosphatidylglycerol synthase transmembrane domain-containing protein [Acidobacteriota bacterium]